MLAQVLLHPLSTPGLSTGPSQCFSSVRESICVQSWTQLWVRKVSPTAIRPRLFSASTPVFAASPTRRSPVPRQSQTGSSRDDASTDVTKKSLHQPLPRAAPRGRTPLQAFRAPDWRARRVAHVGLPTTSSDWASSIRVAQLRTIPRQLLNTRCKEPWFSLIPHVHRTQEHKACDHKQ
jgi:hypothetical protein